MRVLIADKFEKIGIDGLKELGCEVESQPDLGADTLPGALERVDPQILIVRGTRVSAAALKSGASLSLVIRAGAGVDTIDVPAASSLGVFVANCPGKNSIAVAELVMGLLLSCDRRIPDQTAELRAGQWNKGEYSKARGLHGRTLGIVGLGQIGREIMARAHAFGMNVVAWSRNLTLTEATRLGIAYAETPIEVARRADAVTINVAANGETKHLVNAEFLGAMKPGRYLINTSRGSVVDEAALAEAVQDAWHPGRARRVRGRAGWRARRDFAPEVVKLPGVYGTHHVGASTDQAQVAIAHETINIVQQFLPLGDRAQLRQPPGAELGDARALGAASQPPRRAGARVQGALRRGHQRRGSGEHHLSRRHRRRWRGSISTGARRPSSFRRSAAATRTSSRST